MSQPSVSSTCSKSLSDAIMVHVLNFYFAYTKCISCVTLTVVPVRLRDEDVGRLNLLLKRGLYRSRNEAIRAILAEGLQERLGEDEDVTSLVSKLLKLRRSGKTPISFRSRKRVVEIVAEGRR